MEYMEMIKILGEADSTAYQDIICDVNICLTNHSWQISSKSGGFYSEPNREKLVGDLQKIVNAYF